MTASFSYLIGTSTGSKNCARQQCTVQLCSDDAAERRSATGAVGRQRKDIKSVGKGMIGIVVTIGEEELEVVMIVVQLV